MNPVHLIGDDVKVLVSPDTGIRIPTIHRRGNVFTAWSPSPEEIQQLIAGEEIWLVQKGPYIPEMTLVVGQKSSVVPKLAPTDVVKDVNATMAGTEAQQVEVLAGHIERIIYFLGITIVATGLYFLLRGWF